MIDSGNLTDSTLRPYSPATGAYGKPFATDSSGNADYLLFGSDPSAHRLLAASVAGGDGTEEHLLTYDTTDGHQVDDAPMDSATGYWLIGGRVDAQRHRGALLTWQQNGRSATVLPVDTGTGQVGAPVPLAATPQSYFDRMLDIDESTGMAIVGGTDLSDNCAIRRSTFACVNLETGTASPTTSQERCATGLVSDQDGSATMMNGPLIAIGSLMNARGARIDEATGTAGDVQQMGAQSPIFPAVDPVHHLFVVGFLGAQDWAVNNNAMSAIGVYDLQTGTRVSLTEDANLFSAVGGPLWYSGAAVSDRGIQLDPKTRTGYTYGPGGTQVQQFRY